MLNAPIMGIIMRCLIITDLQASCLSGCWDGELANWDSVNHCINHDPHYTIIQYNADTHTSGGDRGGDRENVKYKRQDPGQDRNDSIIFLLL